jgi:DNA-directed RNA polymerase specialized sigma24 family protein
MSAARRRTESAEEVAAEEKIARLLALLVVRDVEQPAAKIKTLKAAGFAVSQIAPILGMTENAVNVALHRARKKGERSTKKKPTARKNRRK